MKIIKSIYKWCTATRLRKALSSILAILILFTSIRFLFLKPKEVKAADIYLGMNEGYGTSSAVNDTNGTVAAGSITNALWKTEDLCKVGNCLYFDGTGDYVSFTDDANLDMAASDTVTLEAWFRTPDITSGTRTLISKEEATGADGGYRIQMNSSGQIVFGIDSNNTSYPLYGITSASAYDDNTWHHVAAVKDGTSTMSLYIDGISVGSISIASTDASNADPLYIGSYFDVSASNGWSGFIDEVKVLRTARTPDQVKADYTGQTPARGTSASFGPDNSWLSDGLVGYWKMDESSGNANDSSGNSTTLTNTGTLPYLNGKFGNGADFTSASSQSFIPEATSFNTYYFDGSDAAVTDPNSVWTGDSNAFNGSTSDYANTSSSGSTSSNYLLAGGTNAPANGGTITRVQARIYAQTAVAGTVTAAIYQYDLYQVLGYATKTGAVGWGSYVTLSKPTGGWTWEYLQSLQTKIYYNSTYAGYAYRVEILVDSAPAISNVSSVSFWVKPDATTNNQLFDLNFNHNINIVSGKVNVSGFTDKEIYVNGNRSNAISANLWQYVTITTNESLNLDQFYIGSSASGSYYYDGLIDEVRIYNRALSPAEVERLYNWSPGPVGWWKLDANTGTSNTAYDSSGNNYVGDPSGNMEWHQEDCKFGACIGSTNADANVGYVSVTDPGTALDFNGNQSYTHEFWYKQTARENTVSLFFSKGGGDVSTAGYNLHMDSSSHLSCYYTDGNGSGLEDATGTTAFDSNWHHVACIMDRQGTLNGTPGLYLLIDGIIDGSDTTLTEGDSTNTTNLCFGECSSTNWEFTSRVDNVQIYNYARTQAQLIEDMNGGHPAPGSPIGSAVGHWKFDEGYGTTVNNSGSSGSSANGTLAGTPNPTWTNDGKFGKGVSFTNTGDNVVTLTNTVSTRNLSEYSISAWIKPTSLPNASNNYDIWSETVNNVSTSLRAQLHIADNLYSCGVDVVGMSFRTGDSTSTRYDVCGTTTLTAGTWYHVVGVFNSNTDLHKVYLNAKLDGSTSHVVGSIADTAPNVVPRIGIFANGNSDFVGTIDEVQFFNFALTGEQIKLLYNQGAATVMGAKSTDSSGNASFSANDEYCPPGQGSTCTPPVAEWKMDENTGSSIKDTSGNGYTGTFSGNTKFDIGKLGSSIYFDGSSDYVQMGDNLDMGSSDAFTIEMWFYPTSDNTTSLLSKKLSSSPADVGYQITWWDYGDGGNTCLDVADGSNSYGVCTPDYSTDTLNKWYHITAVYDNSGTAGSMIYLDGVPYNDYESGSPGTVGNPTNALTLCMGAEAATVPSCQTTGGSTWYQGKLDDVKIYRYARTPAQVAWDYNHGKPVGWWKMDEGSGDAANNSSEVGSTINGDLAGACPGAATCPTWITSGKYSNALSFDGSNDYVDITDNQVFDIDVTRGYSWSMWIKPSSLTEGNWQTVWSQNVTSSIPNFLIYAMNIDGTGLGEPQWGPVTNGIGVGWDHDTNNLITHTKNNVISVGNWSHVVATYDPSPSQANRLKIYINGVDQTDLSDVQSAGTISNISTTSIRIGNNQPYGEYFPGQIDDVRIYNYVLTPIQIKTLYNGGAAVDFYHQP